MLGVGFEPTPPKRIELKSTALDPSAIQAYNVMHPVGFEPTPPKRIELESTALDHSAMNA